MFIESEMKVVVDDNVSTLNLSVFADYIIAAKIDENDYE